MFWIFLEKISDSQVFWRLIHGTFLALGYQLFPDGVPGFDIVHGYGVAKTALGGVFGTGEEAGFRGVVASYLGMLVEGEGRNNYPMALNAASGNPCC